MERLALSSQIVWNFSEKLAVKLDHYVGADHMTYVQALKKAQKEITPPNRVIPYVCYEEWTLGK